MRKKIQLLGILVFCLALLTACGGGNNATSSEGVKTIRISHVLPEVLGDNRYVTKK